jgi:transcriptional regulator with XRE-family HTH domain
MTVGDRIKELRTGKKFTQSVLAELVGLSYIQIGRYEKGKSKPSSRVLQQLAKALDTTTDYIMNGGTEQVQAQLADRELLRQFQEVEQMPERDKSIVKELIDAFLTKRKVQELAG